MRPWTRRRLLAIAGGAIASLGGCLGDVGPAGRDEDSATPTAIPTATIGDRRRMGSQDDLDFHPETAGTAVEHEVLDPDPPYDPGSHFVEPAVRIWNDGPERSLHVFVRGAATGLLLDRTCELESEDAVEVTFETEDSYLVSVRVGEAEPYATVVGRDLFFCNESTTTVRVAPDGTVTAGTFQTAMACPTPTSTE